MRAIGLGLALAGFLVCLTVPALADAVQSIPPTTAAIQWGDAVAAIVPLVVSIVTALGGFGTIALWIITKTLGAPAAAQAKAMGIDALINKALMSAVADVPGAVAGKALELQHLSPVMAGTINNMQAISSKVIDQLGGMDAAELYIKAEMAKAGLVPAAATAADFKAAA